MSVIRQIFLALLLVFIAVPSHAAPPSTGKIIGTITNATSGAVIVGASVVASQSGVTKGSTTTAANGSYTLTLSSGTYTVQASATNYNPNTRAGVAVTSNGTTTVNLTLTPFLDAQAPTVPTGLNSTASGSYSVSLAWSASSDNIGVVGYSIYRWGSQVGSSPTTSFSDVDLTPATSYSYTVDAYDAAGNHSARTAPVSVTTLEVDTTSPTIPGNLTSSVLDGSSIRLVWSPSTDNVGVAQYRIFSNCGSLLGTSTSATYTVTGLGPQTTYFFSVSAVDVSGNISLPSNTAQATTLTATVPLSLPRLLPAAITTNQGYATLTYKTKNDSASTLTNYYANIYYPVGTSVSVVGSSPAATSVTTYADHIACLWSRVNAGVEIIVTLGATNTSGIDGAKIFECQGLYTISKTNYTTTRNQAQIIYDTLVPVFSASPAPPSVTNQIILNLTGSADTQSTLTVKVNGNQQFSGLIDCSGTFSVPVSLNEGLNDIRISAVDRAGNVYGPNVPGTYYYVTRDTTLPTVSLTPSSFLLSAATIDVSAGTQFMAGIDFYVNDTLVASKVADQYTGYDSIQSYGATTFSNIALTVGDNSIKARATDQAGNIGPFSSPITISRDNTPPTIVVSSPAEGALLNTDDPTITGTVVETHPPQYNNRVDVYLNGTYRSSLLISNGSFTFSLWSGLNTHLSEGPNELKIQAVDSVGNVGERLLHVIVDRTPPPMPIVDALPGQTNNPWLIVKGETDPACIVELSYSSDGLSKLASALSNSEGRFILPPVKLDGSGVEDGFYNTMTVKAKDAVGNVSQSRTLNIKLDTVPPAVPGKPVLLTATPNRVNLTWTPSSSLEAIGYNLYRTTVPGSQYVRVNSTPVGEAPYTDAFSFGDQQYYYCVTALDVVGNESGHSEETAVYPGDTSLPDVPLGLQATGGNGTVFLQWTGNAQQNLSEYKIYRRTNQAEVYAQVGSVSQLRTKYIDHYVTNGITYSYVLTASDRYGNESGYSAEVAAIPDASGPSYIGGDVSHYTKLTSSKSPYLAVDDVTLQKSGNDSAKLEIEPGVTVRFLSGLGLKVGDGGIVIADGTEQQPIIFTSGEPSPAAGDWAGIKLVNGSYGSYTRFSYCTIELAGGIKDVDASISVTGTSPTLDHIVVQNNRGRGVYFSGSKGNLTNSTINQGLYVEDVGINSNTTDLVQVDVTRPNISGNTFSNYNKGGIHIGANGFGQLVSANSVQGVDAGSTIELVAENISQNATWPNLGIPIHMMHNPAGDTLHANMYIAGQTSYVTLNIEAGVVIRFESKVPGTGSDDYARGGFSVTAMGVLNINGSSTNPVVFQPDDDAAGRLRDIYIYHTANGTPQSKIYGLVIEKCNGYTSGWTPAWGAVTLAGDASPEIKDSIFRENANFGIHTTDSSAPTIRNSTIDGIMANGSAAPIVENSTISRGTPFQIDGGARPTFRYCQISGTKAYAWGTSRPSLYNNNIHSEIDFTTTGNVVAESNVFYNITEKYFQAAPNAVSSLVNGNSFNGTSSRSVVEVLSTGSVTLSATWPNRGFTYNAYNLTIATGSTLTLSPGTIIRGNSITANGTLIAAGTAQQPVKFEGASLQGKLQLQYSLVTGASTGVSPGVGSSITNCKILANTTGVRISDQVTMSNNVITSNATGISLLSLSGTRSIMNNTISGNSTGISSYNTALTVTNNVIAGNGTGISMQFGSNPSSTPVVNQNQIYGNTTGLTTNWTQVLNGENNWWGDASGPSGAGLGTGDPVSTHVDFTPWLVSGPTMLPVYLSSVYVDPVQFSPGEATATFYGQLTSLADWTVEIRSSSGTIVRIFAGTGTTIANEWDGRSSGGSILSSGDYPFTVKAFNSDGSVADSVEGVVSLDSFSPVAVITLPGEGQVFKEGNQIEVVGTAKDSEFQRYAVYFHMGTAVSYSGYSPVFQGSIPRNNELLGVIDTTGSTSGSNYSIELIAEDTSGNSAVAHRAIKIFSLSAVGATPTVFSPNGDGLSDSTMITASLSMSASWQIEIRDSVGQIRRTASGVGNSISYTWDGRDGQNTMLPSGQYSFEITATEVGSGLVVGPASGTITSSNVAGLAAVIVSPSNNDVVFSTVPIIGTATAADFDKYVLEYLGPGSGSGWQLIGSSNLGHVNEALAYWNVATLPEGAYSLRLTTYCKSSLTASSSIAVRVRSGGVLTVSPSTFNPSAGEFLTFAHALPVDVSVNLKVGDQDGNVIVSLPCSGSSTVWDGRDGSGRLIKDGAYNYWLQGPSSAWNPSLFEGGESITDQVTGQLQTCDGFDPMADGICTILFTLPQPALCFMGIGSNITGGPSYRTLLSAKALQAGNQTIEWDGRDFAGEMVPSGEAVVAYTFLALPSNIIMSTGSTPMVSLVGKSIQRFTPMSRYTNALPGVEIKFSLPITAYLSVTVIDEENGSVRTLRSQDLTEPGVISVTWDGFNDYGQLVDEGWFRVAIRTETASGDASIKYVAVKVGY